ncbi:unnamed protein product [Aspergillus oryzae]|nr:unnamed protein product [Aspergillus oryzae]GMF92498.1 unnamed protein product [Aspergillus oryzae]GMG03242.1 unnamed protein product [Aspergillus oryzae]
MSPHDYADRRSESVTDAVTAMNLEPDRATDTPALNGGSTSLKDDTNGVSRSPSAQNMDVAVKSRSSSQTPVKKEEETSNTADMEEKVGGDITVKQEPGQPPKLTRSSSQKEYAQVAVIKTEKKGFGLRAEADLRPHQFIYEYVGEVINEGQFRRRMRQYDEEGIKHFYFMSLSKGEFVDATKRGNLGRFCNHSCNPNCYVDKWVVGEKLRMGIFAERDIQAGEELVFNYNVDRYGADPQPCYCGEPNCTGFIGGRTQTERATKLSNATIEALGIEDADGWDTAVAKRPRKKKMGEDDEEYVDSVQPKSLEENGVTKVMAALMQCQEKWIAVKLLGRIQRCDDERVRNRVVKMHGYQILNSQLTMWKDDFNVVLQILDILDKFPRLTRNKIIDSKIEVTIQPLTSCGDERVEKRAATLLQVWSTLEVGYRIPRMKRDPNATAQAVNQFERRETIRDQRRRSKSRSRSRSRSIEAPRGPAAQTRGVYGQRNPHHHGPRSFRRQFNPLPTGWFAAESNGRTYYYSARGDTTWTRPTKPAPQPPPPPKESRDKALQDIIDGIMNAKENTPKEKSGTPGTPQVAKKLVNSDFKNNRVEDPTKISEKQQKKVKKYCKEFFDKAVLKHRAYEQRKYEKQAKGMDSKVETPQAPSDDEALDVKMSDDEEDKADEKDTPMTAEETQGGTKRKREGGIAEDSNLGEYISSSKRQRSSTPPPLPPISPGDDPQNMDNAKKILRDDIDSRSENNEFTPPPPPPPPPDDEMPSESPETDHAIDQSPSRAEYITDMNKLKSSQPEIEGKV